MEPVDLAPVQDSVPITSQEHVQTNSKALDDCLRAVISQNHQLIVVNEAQQKVIEDQQHTMVCQSLQLTSYRQLLLEERKLWATGFRDSDTDQAPLLEQIRDWCAAQRKPETALQEGGSQTPTKSMDATDSISRDGSKAKTPFWNPRPDQKPTRLFDVVDDEFNRRAAGLLGASESSRQTDENKKQVETFFAAPGARISGSKASAGLRHGASVPGHLISKNYDSIPLKTQGLVTDEAQRLFDLQACSPTVFEKQSFRTSSHEPDEVSPKPASFSRSRSTLQLDSDPTLRDAGHTPIARTNLIKLTSLDGIASGPGSGSTPKGEIEKTPLETPTTLQEPVRQPSERHDSYFGSVGALVNAVIGDQATYFHIPSPDRDIPLEGPLGLTNSPDNERNIVFLGELDKKLSNVNLKEASGNIGSPVPSTPSGDPSKSSQINVDPELKNVDGSVCETPEPEPPLLLKKSMNFGRAFGKGEDIDYGKGFAKRDPEGPVKQR